MNLSTKNFNIDIVDRYGDAVNYIKFSSYKNGLSSTFSTFDESITEEEYGKYKLTFKIELFNLNTRNPYIDYLTHGRKLRLTLEDEIIDFNIIGITPNYTINGISYSYECQDSFSYQWSKQSINTTLDTNDTQIWKEIGPKTIDQLINKLLEITFLDSHWYLNNSSENHLREFPDDMYTNSGKMKVSLNISESTPYNILIEILNLFGAVLTINYETGELNVFNKERRKQEGLQLRPKINLDTFSYSENSNDLYNIMHVSGGEDAYGGLVTMISSIPTTLCDLLINLDYDNVQDRTKIINSEHADKTDSIYYPDFIVDIDDRNKAESQQVKKIYKKSWNGSQLYYTDNLYEGNADIRNWKTCKTSKELEELLSSYYYAFKDDDDQVLLNKVDDFSQFADFFSTLTKLPYYASFLCDFTYWKNSVLDTNRYNKLLNSLNIDLRNINLLLYVYNSLYSKQKYELDKLISREEEIINQIASLKEQKANLATDELDEISLYSYYCSESIQHENKVFKVDAKTSTNNQTGLCGTLAYPSAISSANIRDLCYVIAEKSDGIYMCIQAYNSSISINESNFSQYWARTTVNDYTPGEPDQKESTYFSYYLPIGDWQVVDGNTLYYGKFDNRIITVPELAKLENSGQYTLYYINDDTLQWEQYSGNVIPNISSNTFTLSQPPSKKTTFYLSLNECYTSLGSSYITQDGVLDNGISSLLFELQSSVWNKNYISLYNSLYGDQWWATKLSELSEKIYEKQNRLKSLVLKMSKTFGDDWRSLEVSALKQLNLSNGILYGDYMSEIKNIGIYIGGQGIRTLSNGYYMTYPGYYNEYKLLLNSVLRPMLLKYKNINSNNLQEKVDYYKTKQSQWWSNFYKDYYDIICETNFSDTDQITSSGLYNSAMKQFLVYQKPTTNYSASYISAEDLEHSVAKISVGDVILLKQDELNTFIDDKGFIMELEDSLPIHSDTTSYITYKNNSSIFTHLTKETNKLLRGIAYGNGAIVGVGTEGFWQYSTDIVTWTEKDSGLTGTFTDVAFIDNKFLATLYDSTPVTGKNKLVELDLISETAIIKEEDLMFGPEGIKKVNNKCYIFGTRGRIIEYSIASKITYILPKTSETITDMFYANEYYFILTNKKLYCIHQNYFNSDNTNLEHLINIYDGSSKDIDLRTVYLLSNNLFIGGRGVDIQMSHWHQMLQTNFLNTNSLWYEKSLPENGVFIRDIVDVNNILFAIGYKTSDGKTNGIIWKSSNYGNSWYSAVEEDNLEDMVQSQWFFDMDVYQDTVYFLSNRNIIGYTIAPQYIAPVMINKIDSRKIEVFVKDNNFSFKSSNILSIVIDNKEYSFDPMENHIVSVSKKVIPQFIKLRIQSISKSLRSNKTTLKIEENTIYNMLVDRLVYFLRFK